jgi:uncharacterized protein YndB with AHSA1/START domain
MKNRTTVERKSERELVVTRTFNGPARIVFEAWTKPELFKQWWVPKSMGASLLSCEMDVRVGGKYRLVFGNDASKPMEFFGRYIEVTPHSRLVWTNGRGYDGRDVQATGRASRRAGRERGTVMKSSISRSAAWLFTTRKRTPTRSTTRPSHVGAEKRTPDNDPDNAVP